MNYDDLKQMIGYLRGMVKCTKCHSAFEEKDILILATLPTEAVFECKCAKCKNATLANLVMQPLGKNEPLISKKDIIDMHEFLQQFNGDFKKLFK
ncbi:hypothetical protein JW911_03960 [Candidatus Peregrinibacteria bacterium]|nr:hypothetical protein [Candidatus Peregrinibacteria bacterium]